MFGQLRGVRLTALALSCLVASVLLFTRPAVAGTTGSILGVVRNSQTGAPVANVSVKATAPSGSQSATTDATGFYSLQTLIPDTYVVSFQVKGYQASSQPGITVQQDFNYRLDVSLTPELKTIASVTSKAAGNLVKPFTGTDVYNVSGAQLNAALGGDNLHRTVYEYLDTVPGVTPIGAGFPAEPSIRGGYDVDNGYEFDGIPITERMTGFFTTNLTDLGVGNVEVYTGGLAAQNAGNGLGVINTVVKAGTYPAFGLVSGGITAPDYNHAARIEFGGATPDRRWSYYVGYDGINSQNDFNFGKAAFNLFQTGISSGNPGYIYTRDIVGNFHYKPNAKDDFQFLYANGLFSDAVNYALNSGTPSAPLLSLQICPGVKPDPNSPSLGSGGTAPNGQTCPAGLYFGALQNGSGNYLGHYNAIGKIQWNHILDSHSSFALRLAENFNQYIFDQKLTDPNIPGTPPVDPACPAYPYKAGSPLPVADGTECTYDLGDYYQSRYANQYYLSFDYTSTPNENLTIKAGAGQEYDHQKRDVRFLNLFQPGTTLPFFSAYTDIPTHVPFVYAQASINAGRWTIEPGLRYSRIYYAIPPNPQLTSTIQPNGTPGGTASAGFLAPSLLGTYRFGLNDVLRWSYATSGQFIGTEFVYRLNSTTYNPFFINPDTHQSTTYKPQVNTSFDLQWEHQFDPETSLKIGPWYRFSNNYLAIYSPLIGLSPSGAPKYGEPTVTNNLKIRSFGIEMGLNHLNNRPTGLSWWLAATLNNYWTQITDFGQVAFINFPLADYFLHKGLFVRSSFVPPFAASLTADAHSHGWHFIPAMYYTEGNFYNVGGCVDRFDAVPINQYTIPVGCKRHAATTLPDGTKTFPVLIPEGHGMGYWKVNATLEKELGSHYVVGIRASNITDNEHDWTSSVTPCYNYPAFSGATYGTGCFSYNGPRSGTVAPVGYIYQNLTTDPMRVEFFFNYKI